MYTLDSSPGYQVAKAAQGLKSYLRKAFLEEGLDVTPEQWAVLCRLQEKEGRSQKELAECTVKDTAVITRMVELLEKRGWIYRLKDPEDKRTWRVYLSDDGWVLMRRLIPLVRATIDRIFCCFEDEERKTLIADMNRLNRHLSELLEEDTCAESALCK